MADINEPGAFRVMPDNMKGNSSGWTKQPQRQQLEDLKATGETVSQSIDSKLTQQRQGNQSKGRPWQNGPAQDDPKKTKPKSDNEKAKPSLI